MGRNVFLSCLDYESTTYSSHSSPEKTLVAAMLARAVIDISSHAPREHTKDATKWFFTPKEEHPLSFHYVLEILELSHKEYLIIRRKALKALHYLETGEDIREQMTPGRFRISK